MNVAYYTNQANKSQIEGATICTVVPWQLRLFNQLCIYKSDASVTCQLAVNTEL